jgi:hypothetical protein
VWGWRGHGHHHTYRESSSTWTTPAQATPKAGSLPDGWIHCLWRSGLAHRCSAHSRRSVLKTTLGRCVMLTGPLQLMAIMLANRVRLEPACRSRKNACHRSSSPRLCCLDLSIGAGQTGRDWYAIDVWEMEVGKRI